jgi:hypothetical protein
MAIRSAVMILSAAVATPVFAQVAGLFGPGSRYGLESQPVTNYRSNYRTNYEGAADQLNESFYPAPRAQDDLNREDFGFGGRDPSSVRGEDPSHAKASRKPGTN